mgnify:CR=1 FL=1
MNQRLLTCLEKLFDPDDQLQLDKDNNPYQDLIYFLTEFYVDNEATPDDDAFWTTFGY